MAEWGSEPKTTCGPVLRVEEWISGEPWRFLLPSLGHWVLIDILSLRCRPLLIHQTGGAGAHGPTKTIPRSTLNTADKTICLIEHVSHWRADPRDK